MCLVFAQRNWSWSVVLATPLLMPLLPPFCFHTKIFHRNEQHVLCMAFFKNNFIFIFFVCCFFLSFLDVRYLTFVAGISLSSTSLSFYFLFFFLFSFFLGFVFIFTGAFFALLAFYEISQKSLNAERLAKNGAGPSTFMRRPQAEKKWS